MISAKCSQPSDLIQVVSARWSQSGGLSQVISAHWSQPSDLGLMSWATRSMDPSQVISAKWSQPNDLNNHTFQIYLCGRGAAWRVIFAYKSQIFRGIFVNRHAFYLNVLVVSHSCAEAAYIFKRMRLWWNIANGNVPSQVCDGTLPLAMFHHQLVMEHCQWQCSLTGELLGVSFSMYIIVCSLCVFLWWGTCETWLETTNNSYISCRRSLLAPVIGDLLS